MVTKNIFPMRIMRPLKSYLRSVFAVFTLAAGVLLAGQAHSQIMASNPNGTPECSSGTGVILRTLPTGQTVSIITGAGFLDRTTHNIVANGSFELPSVSPSSNTNNISIPAWTQSYAVNGYIRDSSVTSPSATINLNGNQFIHVRHGRINPAGTSSPSLPSSPSGGYWNLPETQVLEQDQGIITIPFSIYQGISTQVGYKYRLSFANGYKTSPVDPIIIGLKIGDYPDVYLSAGTGQPATQTIEFEATTTETLIQFTYWGAIRSQQDAFVLDDVIVNACLEGGVGYTVSGNVFNDVDGLNDLAGAVTNGPVVEPSATATAYLVKGGLIVGVSDISNTGAYSFPNVPVGTGYSVVLSNTNTLVTGAPAPLASLSTTPIAWVNVSNQIGTTVGGATNATPGVSAVFAVVSANVTQVNFGIEVGPTATGTSLASQPNPGGTATASVPIANFGNSDPAPGGVTSVIFTGTFPANATSITINGTIYTSAGGAGTTAWPVGGVVVASLTSPVLVDPIDGAVIVALPYTVTDAAGLTASSVVNVPFTPAGKIDTVKAAGVPKQVGPKLFEISYSVVVGNVGATRPTVYNVQADDNLKLTFPTSVGYTVSNYAVSPAAGTPAAACTAAVPAFLGTAAASKMLKGDGDLAGGQSCVITFKVTVDFGTNPIPTVAQNNSVYASAVGTDTIANPGYIVPDTGVAVPPVVGSTTDISATAPPTSGPPGTLPATPALPTVAGADTDVGIPTPVILVIAEDGDILIKKSTATKVGAAGDVVEYVINVTNTSSSPVSDVKVTDTPPLGFTYVAGTAKVNGVTATASPSGEFLIFSVGSIPAKGSIELRYQMKLGDAVEAGEATNCVASAGTNSLTGNAKESGKTCATIIIETGLFLEKRVNLNKAEIGDSVEYSLRVKSVGGTTKNVKITDNMPLGFKLILGTVKLIRGGVTSVMADPAGAPGPQTVYNVGTVANKEVVEIRYRVRLGVGSDLGDGINRAQAKAPFARSSLIATAKVEVTRGVFTREACVIGKVFVDCNQNKVQDACVEDATGKCTAGEPGIPGVRLYMEDGTNITTDENGQYSICGVRAISHVMKVDMTTMPIGSRMGITSNANVGQGSSILMNPKAGELYRADFIESSCYPKILEQVEQRKQNAAGAVNVPLKQVGQDKLGIVFDSKEQELLHPSLRSSSGAAVGGVK